MSARLIGLTGQVRKSESVSDFGALIAVESSANDPIGNIELSFLASCLPIPILYSSESTRLKLVLVFWILKGCFWAIGATLDFFFSSFSMFESRFMDDRAAPTKAGTLCFS